MKTRDMLVIRIGLSIESLDGSVVTVQDRAPESATEEQAETSSAPEPTPPPNAAPPALPPRFRGRDAQPNQARTGSTPDAMAMGRAMADIPP